MDCELYVLNCKSFSLHQASNSPPLHISDKQVFARAVFMENCKISLCIAPCCSMSSWVASVILCYVMWHNITQCDWCSLACCMTIDLWLLRNVCGNNSHWTHVCSLQFSFFIFLLSKGLLQLVKTYKHLSFEKKAACFVSLATRS